jgi:hypothetical protein
MHLIYCAPEGEEFQKRLLIERRSSRSKQVQNAAKRSTELTPKSSTKVIVLVLVVVLMLEWAGTIGAEQSCQLIYNAVRLVHGFACKRQA